MKIEKKDLNLFLLLLPIFKPMCMNFFSVTVWAYRGMLILTLVTVIILLLRSRRKLTSVTLLLMSLELITLLGTLINGGALTEALFNIMGLLHVALVFELCAGFGNMRRMIRCMMLHLELCIYINFVTLILIPNGLFNRAIAGYGVSQEWFLGLDHYFVIWILPACLIAYLYKEYTGKSLRSYILICVSLLTQIIGYSATTGLVAVLIFMIWLFVPAIKKVFTPVVGLIVVGVLVITIIILRNVDYLEPIIVGVLGKDMTFTGRLLIWDNALAAIGQSPVWGYGILGSEQATAVLGKAFGGLTWAGATHCHCQFLQIAFQSGIPGFIMYGVTLVKSFIACQKNKKSRMAQACTVCLFIFCVISITEVYEYPQMYLLFILPAYLDQMIAEFGHGETGKSYSRIEENTVEQV